VFGCGSKIGIDAAVPPALSALSNLCSTSDLRAERVEAAPVRVRRSAARIVRLLERAGRSSVGDGCDLVGAGLSGSGERDDV
jgi:hypothetical protein